MSVAYKTGIFKEDPQGRGTTIQGDAEEKGGDEEANRKKVA